ncbi:MAG TPA: hypothetical protein VEQ35_00815 [Beijerinckia sp.]|jgi:hypothetical protein|nr:hypothetical protein [Beijerinckia sp.]
MALPRTVSEYLANLRTDIKRVTIEDHMAFVVAARHCAETFRRYMAVTGDQSLAIDNVVSKCSILAEEIKAHPGENTDQIKRLRRAALDAVEELATVIGDAEPSHEAMILPLVRR